jgi:hypothetical protein
VLLEAPYYSQYLLHSSLCQSHPKSRIEKNELRSNLDSSPPIIKGKETNRHVVSLYPLKTLPFSFFPFSSLIFSLSFSNSLRNVVILKAFSLRTWLEDPE